MDLKRMQAMRPKVRAAAALLLALLLAGAAWAAWPALAARPWLLFALVLAGSAAGLARGLRRVVGVPQPVAPRADPDSALVARQVMDEQGQPCGETVRVEGDDVVLKREGKFYVVSRTHLTDYGTALWIDSVDWDEAGRRGEAWRQRQENVMQYDAQGMPVETR